MTRKIVALLLIAVLLLSLPACKEEPQSGTHLDWVFVMGTNQGVLTEEGYYYSNENSVLCYADIATGNSVVLCQKVGCKHVYGLEGKERCDAELDINASTLMFENDKLYYADHENTLWSRNATGAELTELGMLAKKFVEEQKSVHFVSLSAICNGYLYYCGNISETKVNGGGEPGPNGNVVGQYISRYNLAQRKEEILVHLEMKNYAESIQPIAVRETGVLYLYQEGLDPQKDWEDAKAKVEAMKTMLVEVRYLDLTTGKTTTLLSGTYSQYQTFIALENGKLYYAGNASTNRGVRSYDLATGKDTVFYDGELSSTYYGNGYWLRSKWLDAQTAERHIYDTNTGKTSPCELNGNFYTLHQSTHGLVMYYNDRSTRDGFYYISYASLADGLQEADLKFLYVNS